MTVSTINSVAEFVTNGATKNFPFYFKFLDSRDLVVTYIDPNGTSTVLTMGTQYTVSGAGNDKGGGIYTTTALLGPGKLIVSRDMEAYQQTSLRNQGKFLAETHEDVFDKLTMLSQQGFAVIKRALSRPFGREYFDAEENRITGLADPKSPQDAATKVYADGAVSGAISYTDARLLHTVRSVDGETLTQLPAVASRANKVMGFDAAGQPIGVLPASGSGTELAIDMANPDLGAGLSAWKISKLTKAIENVGDALNHLEVPLWAFAKKAVGYVEGGDPSTWNWGPAILAADAAIDAVSLNGGCIVAKSGTYGIGTQATIKGLGKTLKDAPINLLRGGRKS